MNATLGVMTILILLVAAVLMTRQTPSIANASTGAAAEAGNQQPDRPRGAPDRDDVDEMLRRWTPGPRLAGEEMMAKYGVPQEATMERMIWQNAGPFKRIMLTREELPHDFPLTHMDYLEHTINYNVPNDKTDEVHAFDASITIYRVAGELSARCDLESNNVLTLNLANDVVMGKKTVAAARQEFGKAVTDRTLGNPPPSTMALQFQPMSPMAAADREKTTLPGTSQRAESAKMAITGASPAAGANGDAEILALMIALDENEVHAAMTAEHKKVGEDTRAYARMLHQQHGKHIGATEQLGSKIGVTPLESPAVDDLHNQGADQLAKLVPLTGGEFEEKFAESMAAGHRDALKMIDDWMGKANHAALKEHLTETRRHLEAHMKEAERLKVRR